MKVGVGLLVFLLAPSLCLAGERLSIRLVEASNDGKGAAGVEDIAGMLRKNINYQSFALLGRGSMPLPAQNAASRIGAYTVTGSGPQNNLSIRVRKGGSEVLSTTVRLKDRTPLVVGGFPGGKGKMVLVFVAE